MKISATGTSSQSAIFENGPRDSDKIHTMGSHLKTTSEIILPASVLNDAATFKGIQK